MSRIILIVIMSIFISIQNAYALNLNIKSISEDHEDAILMDKDTGDEWFVMEGDEIEGWVVTKINKDSVLIKKEAEGEITYDIVRKLTLPNKISIMPVQ